MEEHPTFYNCKFHEYGKEGYAYFYCEITGKKCKYIDDASNCKDYKHEKEV